MFLIVFPNQLYASHPGLELNPSTVLLIEDSLFFGDPGYPARFHKQKLWLHRATMKRYEQGLISQGFKTKYVDYRPDKPDRLSDQLHSFGVSSEDLIATIQPCDFLLEKRLKRWVREMNVDLHLLPDPGFINDSQQNSEYRATKKRWFMADFYKWQRKRLDILVEDGEPVGGKWSFDADNRKKVPKRLISEIPSLDFFEADKIAESAKDHIEQNFSEHPGILDQLFYPTSHEEAEQWLERFLEQRFERFGAYEDAIVQGESWLWHSVLTPTLNIGLLTPKQVVEKTLRYAKQNEVPLNSLEGFIRQIIGWREFMRATYEDLGVKMRTTNHWNHQRDIPDCFYDGSTGIVPIDDTIKRILKTGYCHHIERLMVLGGFMFLCEFHPDQIYRWFMEMFVDSYDWVMVPNVYAMSQHADGGQITTKPYFSGSSYIRKMSHYKTGDWCEVWDGLYWRWILNHVDDLSKNPRWAMMCSMAKKMDAAKQKTHLTNAESFLSKLDSR